MLDEDRTGDRLWVSTQCSHASFSQGYGVESTELGSGIRMTWVLVQSLLLATIQSWASIGSLFSYLKNGDGGGNRC